MEISNKGKLGRTPSGDLKLSLLFWFDKISFFIPFSIPVFSIFLAFASRDSVESSIPILSLFTSARKQYIVLPISCCANLKNWTERISFINKRNYHRIIPYTQFSPAFSVFAIMSVRDVNCRLREFIRESTSYFAGIRRWLVINLLLITPTPLLRRRRR